MYKGKKRSVLPPIVFKSIPIPIPRKERSNTLAEENKRNTITSLPDTTTIATSSIVDSYISDSYLILIAVNEFTDPHFISLNSPINDAEKLADCLAPHGFKVYRKLYNQAATPTSILKCFDDISNVNASRIIVYIGTHGFTYNINIDNEKISIPYFALSLTEKSNPRSTAFSMDNLKKLSQSLTCNHQCFISDACHSGATLYQTRSISYNDLLMRRSCIALCSSSGDQKSIDDREGSILITELVNIINTPSLFLHNTATFEGKRYTTFNHIIDLLRQKVYNKSIQMNCGTTQFIQYGSLSHKNEGCMIFFQNNTINHYNEEEKIRPRSI